MVKITDKIALHGNEVIRGDKGSIAVIFNNLTGRNFKNPEDYNDYLRSMEYEWGIKIKGEICQIGENGKIKGKYSII